MLAEADVDTTVGRITARRLVEVGVVAVVRQTHSECQGHIDAPCREAGDVILEEQREIDQLVGRAAMPAGPNRVGHLCVGMVVERQAFAVGIEEIIVATYVFLGLHKGETRPAVDAFHELTVHLEVDTCGVGTCRLVGIIADAHVVDVVRNHMGEPLEIGFRSQDERPIPSMELEVVACHHLIRLLRPGILEEATVAVAYLAIERCLRVDTTRQAIDHLILLIIFRLVSNTGPRADIDLVIITPEVGPQTACDDKLTFVLVGNGP